VLIVIFPEIPKPLAGPGLLRKLRRSRPAAVRHECFRHPGGQIGSPRSCAALALLPPCAEGCVIALEISGRNARVQAQQHRWDGLRAALERLPGERGWSRAGPPSASTLAGLAEVHRKRWFSAGGFRLAMK